MRINLFYFILIAICLFFSCGEEGSDVSIDFKSNYFPVNGAQWVEYRVDSISYRYSAPDVFVDTFSFELREQISDSFLDNQGRLTYKIERFKRPIGGSVWQINRVWSLNPFIDKIEKNEDEYRYIKMVFPPQVGKTWNGTAYINTDAQEIQWLIRNGKDWTFEYTKVDEPASYGSYTFDSTLTIVHVDDSNKIELDLSKEVYAKKVGMVYKEVRILDKQNVLNSWDEPEEGFIVRYTVLDYKQ